MQEQVSKFRAFIAVALPDSLKESLREVQERFKKVGGKVGWVRPAGMHVTLKFLGDVEEGMIPEIGGCMGRALGGRKAFTIGFSGAGVFPDLRRPRVLWVAAQEGAEELGEMAAALDPLLSEIGFDREKRPFRPHMTLGRIKVLGDRERLAALIAEHRETDVGRMTANAVRLVESRLRPDGAIYTTRFSVDLLE